MRVGFWLNHSSLADPKCFDVLWYMSTEVIKYFVFSCLLIIKLATKED